jgi:hypothetical protein
LVRVAVPIDERLRNWLHPEGECLVFIGPRTRDGYGKIAPSRQTTLLAHRVAWETEHGPIPEGLQVLHSCDNPPCCLPEHLFLGTNDDNMADKKRKGRNPRGSANVKARLEEADIPAINRLLERGINHCEIARLFGVSASTIDAIARGTNWAWLPCP